VRLPRLSARYRRLRFGGSVERTPGCDDRSLDICSVADLDRDGQVVVRLPDPAVDLLVVKAAGQVYALNNRCPHAGVPLDSNGVVAGRTITCAAHGRQFDLRSGRCLGQCGGARRPLTMFSAWTEGDRVKVAVRCDMPLPLTLSVSRAT
jgi:3-phenylpropionate/trans-cinnamate dioxygenase ferredoxin subunit